MDPETLAARIKNQAEQLHWCFGDITTEQTLRQIRTLNNTLAEFGLEIAFRAAREGMTQKEIARALDVPASTLTGLKREALSR